MNLLLVWKAWYTVLHKTPGQLLIAFQDGIWRTQFAIARAAKLQNYKLLQNVHYRLIPEKSCIIL